MQGEQHQRTMDGLPPGFRFFPTDEELIAWYLAKKIVDASFTTSAIRDVDLYSFDPWDLPCQELQEAARRGDGEQKCCYFFCKRSSKYSSGVRARRATQSGYWKSTGRDKAVHSSAGGHLVGTKKTLVFHSGRAPKGKKTRWVMHEYALGERSSSALLRGAQSEWVICRVLVKKDPSSYNKLETGETVHDRQPSPDACHLVPMEPDGCDGDQQDANSQSVTHAMGGDEKDCQYRQMAHDEEQELLMMMNNISGSSCTRPPWAIHDDQLGTNCSALEFMQMMLKSDDANYSLPELLEYDDGYDE